MRDPPEPPNVPQNFEFSRTMMGEVEDRGLENQCTCIVHDGTNGRAPLAEGATD
jgi:hypothetical protein